MALNRNYAIYLLKKICIKPLILSIEIKILIFTKIELSCFRLARKNTIIIHVHVICILYNAYYNNSVTIPQKVYLPIRVVVGENYAFTEIIIIYTHNIYILHYSVLYILVGGMRTYAFYSNKCSNNVHTRPF